MLTKTRIDELAGRKGVKTIAVQNFLGTLSATAPKYEALMNLKQDARDYNWNATTVAAITTGINELYL